MSDNQEVSNSKIASSFFWVLIEKFGYSGINLISNLILARLLSPYEFGLIGSVAIVISISNMIVDSGMGAALVQKKNTTNKDFNTIFTFNLFISISLYFIIFISAPLIADYLGSSVLKDIIRVLSLTLIFNAFTLTQRVILIKKLLFKRQSLISLISLIVSVTFAILAAYNNWGVWAIVTQSLLYSGIFSIIIFFVIRYVPKLEFSYHSFRELLGFGGRVVLSSAIQVGYGDIISSVIAKVYTIHITGLYAQSQKLLSLPVYIFKSLFDSVAFPILSRTKNRDEFKIMCSQINRFIYLIAFPLLLAIPFNTRRIIEVVLGEQWLEADKIFTILSIGVIVSLIDVAALGTLKSAGEAKTLLNMGASKAIIGISILFVTFLFSIELLVCGVILTNLIAGFLAIYQIDQLTPYKIKDQLRDISIPLLISITANSLAHFFLYFVTFEQAVIDLLVFITIMVFVFTILCLLFKINELNLIIKKLKKK
ncbi:lipopolysaccharide biosynthesis protein [Capnocytophaga cynodegmi]|uniref:lipopolysaccharide biosynthesis protein n=1 Tax=Capnocytophaga cynodegmi TaxID=28189 RepID=UPI00385A957C